MKVSILKILLVVLLARISSVWTITCYYCANYDQYNGEYDYSSSCIAPVSGETDTCTNGNYCFISSVLLANLDTQFIRGCSWSNLPKNVTSKLSGYQSAISFCNTNYCNKATNRQQSTIYVSASLIFYLLFK